MAETEKWCVLPYLDRVVAHLESLVNALHHLVEACEIKPGWWLSVQLTDASSQSHKRPKLCLLLIYDLYIKKMLFNFFAFQAGLPALLSRTFNLVSVSRQQSLCGSSR